MTTTLSLALSYAAAGYDVLPLHGITEPAPADAVKAFLAGELGKKEAQALARCTCGEHPCKSPGKHPRVTMDAASRDPKQLALWFQHPRIPTNVGIRLPPEQFALDFDLYVKGVPEQLEGMRLRGLPPTLVQESGSGGLHMIYQGEPGTAYGSTFGGSAGIDIIHHGNRYLAAAPSLHWTGSVYRWVTDSDPARAADWILEQARRGARGYATAKPRATNPGNTRPLVCPFDVEPAAWAVTLASEILAPAIANDEPGSTEHGHLTLARAACHLVAGCELTDAEALDVLWEHYNPRCVPPWGEDEFADFERCVMTAGANAEPGYLVPSEQARAMHDRAVARRAKVEKPKRASVEPSADWGTLPITIFDPGEEPEALNYLVGPFAPGKVSAIIGYANNAKTPAALDLALCLAAGERWLGMPCKQTKTLVVLAEGARNARRKALRLARAKGGTLETVRGDLDIGRMPSASLTPDDARELVERAYAQGYRALIIDTYGAVLDSNIDRNTAAFSDALKAMGDFSDEVGDFLVVVLLHLNKTVKPGTPLLAAIDGHNSIAGALQTALALTRPDQSDDYTFTLTCERAPDGATPPITFTWCDVPEPNRTVGQRIAHARAEGQTNDPAAWGLRAEVDAATTARAPDHDHALDVRVLAWFEAHRPHGHGADKTEVRAGLGKAKHADTDSRVLVSLRRLTESGKIGCDRSPTAARARFGLLGKKYSHAQGIVDRSGEISGGVDVTEGAALIRAERALRA